VKAALFYERLEDGVVRCLLCPHGCRLRPGAQGLCRVRRNESGVLRATTYGRLAADGMDPIEKKPLYHFYPGSWIYSLAAYGCNLGCRFCQNWRLSQGDGPAVEVTPDAAVEAVERGRRKGVPCVGLAYTYSEPTVWYEFVYDTARLAKARGYVNVLVTNGFIAERPLRQLLPEVDAMNVDLKGFDEQFYRRYCRGERDPVLRTIRLAHAAGCHLELTCLLIPGLNDSEAELGKLFDWVADLDAEIPVHLSRYYPSYRLTVPPTPVATLRRAAELARRRLKYVYLGNVSEPGGSDTRCPRCGVTVIARMGHAVTGCRLRDRRCPACGQEIRLVGQVLCEQPTRGEEVDGQA